MLSDKQVEQYRETGWLVVEDMLTPTVLAETHAVLDQLITEARSVTAHNEVYDLEPGHRPESPRVRRIKTPHRVHPLFMKIAKLPKLLAVLQQLLGPSGVRLHGSKINLKSPRYGSPVEWHQDWAFYPHSNDDLLAVGVMLDDCTVENGAMLVLPGTHRGPVYDHHADGAFCGAMDPAQVDLDFSRAVPVTGPAGAMSFHQVRLVHGSAQNRSDHARRLLLYEFAAADAWPFAGIKDLREFDERLIAGQPTITPRLAPVPVRMPLPPASHQGSIYENQTSAKRRYFEQHEPAPV